MAAPIEYEVTGIESLDADIKKLVSVDPSVAGADILNVVNVTVSF